MAAGCRAPGVGWLPFKRGERVGDPLEHRHGAHNYHPLPVVATSAVGAWITDPEGNRYLDCLAAYSAVNFSGDGEKLATVGSFPDYMLTVWDWNREQIILRTKGAPAPPEPPPCRWRPAGCRLCSVCRARA